MSNADPNNINRNHNKGQEDAKSGTYDPPKNDVVRQVVGRQDYEQRQYESYNAGYGHTKDQSK